MVAPLVIYGAIAAVGAIAGWMNSKEAREATAEERAEMQRLADEIQSPDFDFSQLRPEQYALVSRHIPKLADYVAEVAPQMVQAQSADARLGRDSARDALQRLRSVATGERDIAGEAEQNKALRAAQIANQGMQGQVMQNFAQRGMSGSGLELAASLNNAQAGGDRAAEASQRIAADTYRNRLTAMREAAQIGSQIRGEDVDLESKNTGVFNAFTQRQAANRQQWAQRNAEMQNDADRYNIGLQQGVHDRNVATKNNFAIQERENKNNLIQRGFDNKMGIYRARAGLSGDRVGDIRSNAKDNANMISGATDAAQTGYAYSQYKPRNTEGTNSGGYYGQQEQELDAYGRPKRRVP